MHNLSDDRISHRKAACAGGRGPLGSADARRPAHSGDESGAHGVASPACSSRVLRCEALRGDMHVLPSRRRPVSAARPSRSGEAGGKSGTQEDVPDARRTTGYNTQEYLRSHHRRLLLHRLSLVHTNMLRARRALAQGISQVRRRIHNERDANQQVGDTMPLKRTSGRVLEPENSVSFAATAFASAITNSPVQAVQALRVRVFSKHDG